MFRIFPTTVVVCINSVNWQTHRVWTYETYLYARRFGCINNGVSDCVPSHQKRPPWWGRVGDLWEAVFNSTKVQAACIQRGKPRLLRSLSQSVERINFTLSLKFLTSSVLFLCCWNHRRFFLLEKSFTILSNNIIKDSKKLIYAVT